MHVSFWVAGYFIFLEPWWYLDAFGICDPLLNNMVTKDFKSSCFTYENQVMKCNMNVWNPSLLFPVQTCFLSFSKKLWQHSVKTFENEDPERDSKKQNLTFVLLWTDKKYVQTHAYCNKTMDFCFTHWIETKLMCCKERLVIKKSIKEIHQAELQSVLENVTFSMLSSFTHNRCHWMFFLSGHTSSFFLFNEPSWECKLTRA